MTLPHNIQPFSSGNLLITLLTCLLAFTVYAFYKIVIHPKMRMSFYAKQGLPTSYFPLIGIYKDGLQNLKNHGDAQYYAKHRARTTPQRVICTNFGSSAYISLCDPALIKEFYLKTENYVKDPEFMELYCAVLGKGLLTSEGKEWKIQRKILSSSFHFGFLKSILPSIQSTAQQHLNELRNGPLEGVHIMDAFQKITGEVVGKVFFGEQLNQFSLDGKPLTLALAEIMANVGYLNLSIEKHLLGGWFVKKGILPKHKKLMQSVKDFRSVCRKIVDERKKKRADQEDMSSTKDMLDLLLDYNGEEGKISEEGIIDQFVTFFMAGMDTTGHLLTMAVNYLLRHPEHAQRLIEEVKLHYGNGMNITIEDLNKLEFTMAFLRETLRMATPVPGVFPRRVLKDHMLHDISMKEGDMVNVDYFYNCFDTNFFPEPDVFNPERFLDKEKATTEAYAFTPFSAGARNCLGQHLALIEARLILAEFLMMFDFKFQEGYKLAMNFKFLYEPEKPIMLDLTVKKNE